MRILAGLTLILASLSLGGCMLAFEAAAVATYPLNKQGKFEDAQKKYTTDIRFGMYDEAIGFVEPEEQNRFRQEMDRLREVRFSDYRIDSIQMNPAKTEAVAHVVLRGYWLSSPFEQEVRAVQKWRRIAPTQNWYVTPDWDALLKPPSGS
jgi:hypothetical protein